MSHRRVAILISGSGSNMVALVNSMNGDHPARPCIVISNDPEAGGLAKASELGVPNRCVDLHDSASREEFEERLQEVLVEARAELICLAGFMLVLTPGFVRFWQGRILNIHPSLLPLFKGLHTHERVLEAGMAVHGCTAHEVTAELDDGPIIGQAVIPVLPGDSAESLAERLLHVEHRLYPEALRRFCEGGERPFILI